MTGLQGEKKLLAALKASLGCGVRRGVQTALCKSSSTLGIYGCRHQLYHSFCPGLRSLSEK